MMHRLDAVDLAPAVSVPVAAASPSVTFADPALVASGWYPILAAKKLRGQGPWQGSVAGRKLVAWKDPAGNFTVADGHCAHLGANLAEGQVTAQGLVCPFHGWCWKTTGQACGPGSDATRQLRTYTTQERWGLVWAWLGGKSPAKFPDAPDDWHAWRLPARTVACHPHLVLANGFDLMHLGQAHQLDVQSAVLAHEDGEVALRYEAHVRPSPMRRVLGVAGKSVDATFRSHGASLVYAQVRSPVRFDALFCATPDGHGSSVSQAILFLPRRRSALRVLALLLDMVAVDGPLLEGLRFRRQFAPSDSALAAYAQRVDRVEAWT